MNEVVEPEEEEKKELWGNIPTLDNTTTFLLG
jgi:hypothetical protein